MMKSPQSKPMLREVDDGDIKKLAKKFHSGMINLLITARVECDMKLEAGSRLTSKDRKNLFDYENEKHDPTIRVFCQIMAAYVMYLQINYPRKLEPLVKIVLEMLRL